MHGGSIGGGASSTISANLVVLQRGKFILGTCRCGLLASGHAHSYLLR